MTPSDTSTMPYLLKPEEVAKLLRVGRTTVYALFKSGELESVPVGRLRRVHPDALRDYIDNLRKQSTASMPIAA